MPAPRAGRERIGADLTPLMPGRWIGEPVEIAGPRAAPATLVRWWTDTCPFCEASMPALEELRLEFASEGLATVGVYHPKPPREVSDDFVQASASELGYHGPLAVDERWSALRAVWLDTGERGFTSASFLVDAQGRLRFLHPGPEFHPSSDAEHARCAADYADLRAAIRALISESSGG